MIYLSTQPADISLFGFNVFETSGDETPKETDSERQTDRHIRESKTETKDLLWFERKYLN